MNAAPGASYEAVADGFATGLTGTIGVRLIDNEGATTTVRTTSGIAEYPAGSGIYTVTLTAPAVAGQYTIVWDNGATTPGNVATDDLVVTYTPLTAPTGSLYTTSDQLKATLEITGETYADADIDLAIDTACRVIDLYKNTRFYPTTETRKYTADCDQRTLRIYDLNTLNTLSVDINGDGVYEQTWTVNTDFYLEPMNADLTGQPWNRVTIRRLSGRIWPTWQYAVEIVGSFGWATAPTPVQEASRILAGRYLKRARETPYGIVTIGADALTAARLGRIDPDVAFMLDNLESDQPTLIL